MSPIHRELPRWAAAIVSVAVFFAFMVLIGIATIPIADYYFWSPELVVLIGTPLAVIIAYVLAKLVYRALRSDSAHHGLRVRLPVASPARLHWFWRGLAGVLLGSICGSLSFWLDLRVDNWIRRIVTVLLGDQNASWVLWEWRIAIGVALFVPAILIAFAVYGVLTRYFGPMYGDAETRCRNCGYILRGISEPVCPECGTQI